MPDVTTAEVLHRHVDIQSLANCTFQTCRTRGSGETSNDYISILVRDDYKTTIGGHFGKV